MHDINQLRCQGWIQNYLDDKQEMIFLHSVIGEVVFRELYQRNPVNLRTMLQSLSAVINNRNLDAEDQLRYISYGINVGRRLGLSVDAIAILNLTGLHLEYFRRLDEAINILLHAKRIVEKTNSEQTLWGGHTFNNLAVIYQTNNDFIAARKYFQQAVTIYRNCGEVARGNLGYALHNIATLTLMAGDTEEALCIEDEAEPLVRQYGIIHLGEIYDVRRECYCDLVNRKYMRYDQLRNKPDTNPILLKKLERTIKDHMEKALVCGQLAIDYKQLYDDSNQQQIMSSIENHAANKAHYRRDPLAAAEIEAVLAFYIRTTGERSVHSGHTYNKMCLIYDNLGNAPKACESGEKAVEILSYCLGENHDAVENAKYNLQVAQGALQ